MDTKDKLAATAGNEPSSPSRAGGGEVSEPLKLADLRELEALFVRGHALFPGELKYALRAVRELIAIRETENAYERLRKAAEAFLSSRSPGPSEWQALRAALEEK